MNNQGKGLFSIRTVLLAMVLIIMVFSLFVILPASLPSMNDIDQDIFWACSVWGAAPQLFYTWTWDTSEQPALDEWLDVLVEGQFYEVYTCGQRMSITYAGEPDEGILQHFHRVLPDKGMGELNAEVDPENPNRIIISGYLQYGFLPDVDNATIDYLINDYHNPLSSAAANALAANVSKDIYDLLVNTPLPKTVGIVRDTRLTIAFTNYTKNDSKSEYFTTTTDGTGYFSYALEPDPNADYYMVTVSNARRVVAPTARGQNVRTYWENSVFYSTHLDCGNLPGIKRDEGRNRAWVFGGIILTGAAFLLIWYLWHRKRKEFYEETEEAKELETDHSGEIETVPGGETDRLEITFPQIEKPLPDVWGFNDLLEVKFRLKDSDGGPVPNTECVVEWGDGGSENLISDLQGETENYHTFTEKGEYNISGSYTDPETQRKPSSWRIIRIVDYREEMVRIFNRMLRTLELETVTIDNRLTAREVERILAPALEGLPHETLQAVVAGFEEANYSIHAISRDSYVRMYLAVKEVSDFGKQEQQPAKDTTE